MNKIEQNRKSIRDSVGEAIVQLGITNPKVVVINADLSGTCRTKHFADTFPERCFNVGVAEQNMVSFAAGLAHEGFIPYVFSMAPFLSMRACEQVRTDVAYANLNVKFIATYAGVSGGISGATHWSIEDVAIMSAIPNMTVCEPSDWNNAYNMLISICDINGPVYMRCSVLPVEPIIVGNKDDYMKSRIIKSGQDGMFICSGIVVEYAFHAAQELHSENGLNIGVIDMRTTKPLDCAAVDLAVTTKHVVVAQDHNVIGGLGSIVGTYIAAHNANTKFAVCGVNDIFTPMAHAEYLYKKFGYDKSGLKRTMLSLFE